MKTITQKTFIPSAAPGEVYDAFVSAKKHAAFTGSPATGTARVGARFTTEWPAGMPASRVEFTFKAARGGTEIRMVHSHVPSAQAAGYRQGWIDYYWTPLKTYFGGREE